MATEVWTAMPSKGFIKVTYTPGVDSYPVSEVHVLEMPQGYDPAAPNHDPLAAGFPLVTPLLQGFDINYGSAENPSEHWLRQLRIDVRGHGWNTVEAESIISQGPEVEIVVGLSTATAVCDYGGRCPRRR